MLGRCIRVAVTYSFIDEVHTARDVMDLHQCLRTCHIRYRRVGEDFMR